MKVGAVEGRAKEEPVHRVRHEALFVEAALDRLLLLIDREEEGSVSSTARARLLEAASAAMGVTVGMRALEERRVKVAVWRRKLEALMADRGVTQRTPEWYEARKTMVTASDVAQALGCSKFGTQRTFFQKKCGAPEEQAAFDATLPPLKWGVMYEPVAQGIYSAANLGVRIHEFGLLRHPSLPFVGASPDGITDLGVMLEIKCPWRRKIVEGEIPLQYYYQIQAQLAVCELGECDYFECELFEVDGPDDEAWASREVVHERGAFLELQLRKEQPPPPEYLYPPGCVVGGTKESLEAWVASVRLEAGDVKDVKDIKDIREHWWVLRRRSTTRVMFEPSFAKEMFDRLATVWDRTVEYRGDRDRYLAEVGAALPPPPPSDEHEKTRREVALADAESIDRFCSPAAGYAFVDEP
jgi:putative phage-type endonuclease